MYVSLSLDGATDRWYLRTCTCNRESQSYVCMYVCMYVLTNFMYCKSIIGWQKAFMIITATSSEPLMISPIEAPKTPPFLAVHGLR